MKKTNNIGKIFLIILLVAAVSAGIIEGAIYLFGLESALVGLGVIGLVSAILILTDNKPQKKNQYHRERIWKAEQMDDELIRERYCK